MYSFAHSLKIYSIVKFQHSVWMTVLIRSVQYVQLLSGYFTLKAFQLWLC